MAQIVSTTINVDGTFNSGIFGTNAKKDYAVMQASLVYGAAGTTLKVFLQTSLDEGASWKDVICEAFLLASATKAGAVSKEIVATVTTPTDGTLADDTIVNGVLGIKWRVKWIVVGSYTGSSLTVYVDLHEQR